MASATAQEQELPSLQFYSSDWLGVIVSTNSKVVIENVRNQEIKSTENWARKMNADRSAEFLSLAIKWSPNVTCFRDVDCHEEITEHVDNAMCYLLYVLSTQRVKR